MDRDSLRKQLYDEIHSQFESKLREARRQKSELQEEIELSEDKWRNERRRLHSEIDRLELALTEAREARRKAPTPKTKEVDQEEISRIQTAADERLKQAERAWDSERSSLRAEVSRLQNGIAEMIERSNNPLRSNQAEQDKLESRLNDALKARRQAEDALLKAKQEWEEEKVQLVGDMVKNRRTNVPPAAPDKPQQDNARVAQLERQLDEAIRIRDKQIRELESANGILERELEKARQVAMTPKADQSADVARLKSELDAAKEKMRELVKAHQSAPAAKAGQNDDVARLKADLEEARAQAVLASRKVEDEKFASDKEKTKLEKELRQALSTKNGLERELEKARQELLRRGEESLKAVDTDAIEQLRREYEESIQELMREKDQLAEALQASNSLLEDERNRVGDDPNSVSAEVVEQLRRQYDERMQDMIHQKTQLSEELRNATSLLEEERTRLSVNGTQNHTDTTDMDPHAIDAEVERIQDMIAGIARIIDDPETELSTVIRKNVERAELDAYLRGILFSLGRGQGL